MAFKPDHQILYPGTTKDGNRVVAVIGWAHDFAAYVGRKPDWTQEQIARDGDKISKEDARRLFPNLKEYYYRT